MAKKKEIEYWGCSKAVLSSNDDPVTVEARCYARTKTRYRYQILINGEVVIESPDTPELGDGAKCCFHKSQVSWKRQVTRTMNAQWPISSENFQKKGKVFHDPAFFWQRF